MKKSADRFLAISASIRTRGEHHLLVSSFTDATVDDDGLGEHGQRHHDLELPRASNADNQPLPSDLPIVRSRRVEERARDGVHSGVESRGWGWPTRAAFLKV